MTMVVYLVCREWSNYLIDGRVAGLVYVVDATDITQQAIRTAAE